MSAKGRAAERNRLYEWFCMLAGAEHVMSPERRAELEAWEAIYVTGSGNFGSSDWPGWVEMGLPPKPTFEESPPRSLRKPPTLRERIEVHRRDGYRCVRCGSTEDLHVDHVIPVSKGGTNNLDNLQLLCRDCNLRKGARV